MFTSRPALFGFTMNSVLCNSEARSTVSGDAGVPAVVTTDREGPPYGVAFTTGFHSARPAACAGQRASAGWLSAGIPTAPPTRMPSYPPAANRSADTISSRDKNPCT